MTQKANKEEWSQKNVFFSEKMELLFGRKDDSLVSSLRLVQF